jgi:phosphomannomutase/phosphoglucomutase
MTTPKMKRLLRFSLTSHLRIMLIGALVAMLLVGAIVFLGVLIPNNQHINSISNQLRAQQAAKLIEYSLGNIEKRISFLADQDNAKAALSSKDTSAIDAITTQMTQSFPEATLALAIPVGMVNTPELGQAIGFAPVDLVRRSENNEPTKPEASKKGDAWIMYFVAPVNDTSGIRSGTLLIGIQAKTLSNIWGNLDNSLGKYSLFQNDKPVISQGSGDGNNELVKLPYADLSVQFNAANSTETASSGAILFIVAVLIALMINAAAIFVGEMRLQKQMRDDAAHLLKFIHAIINNQPASVPVLKNTLLNSISQSLGHYSKLISKNKDSKLATSVAEKIKKAPKAPIEPAVATDINKTTELKESASTSDTVDTPALDVDSASEAVTQSDETIAEPVFEQQEEVLDIDLINELDDLFGNVETPAKASSAKDILDVDSPSKTSAEAAIANVSHEIFRAYDIRGVVGETLTDEVVNLIGLAIGTEAITKGERSILVGYDGRLSSPQLNSVLCRAIAKTGCQVTSIGQVSTPVLYYATATRSTRSGVMITGSHNPPNYNGFKIVLAGKTLSGEDIQALYDRIQNNQFATGDGYITDVTGITDRYIKHIIKEIKLNRRLKVVVDCGNGAAGLTAPQTLEGINCEVIPLFCEVDGHFPNHHPDPSNPKNLADLIEKVKSENADIGIAFDGDGDRLGVVTNTGEIIHADRVLAILAKSVLARNAGGSIIFDVKCSRILPQAIREAGGVPIMWKTGHSFIKAKLKETDALLAGEMSGHIFFNERWFGFDDGLYSAARLLEVLAERQISTQEIFDSLPATISTPEINVSIREDKKFGVIESLIEHDVFAGGDGKVITIDGVRVDYVDGWGLVRASNTTPCLVLRFEADTEEALMRIKDLFKAKLLAVDSSLSLNF